MKLQIKLNLALFLGLTITLIAFAVFDTVQSQDQLKKQITAASVNTIKRLGVTLSAPLWEFDVTTAKNIAFAELGANDLMAISVINFEGKSLFKLHWDETKGQAVAGDYQGSVLLETQEDIQFKVEKEVFKAGSVQLIFSDRTLRQAFSNAIKRSIVQVILLDVVILALMGYLTQHLVLTPLQTINTRVNDIAHGQGDLTKRVDDSASDELGDLAKGINLFIDNVHSVIREVSSVSHNLDQASIDGQQNTVELNALVTEQNERVAHIAQSMHEMSASSQEVSAQSASQASVMQETTALVNTGTQQVKIANTMIHELAENINSSTQTTAKLNDHAQDISSVITVIEGIAQQTNLLALNAAIEAARAGEQGRGFAVVADEVRTLAQRTQQSASEVVGIIGQLQEHSSTTLTMMDTGLVKTQQNVVSMDKAGQTFAQIEKAIHENLDSASLIATAAEQQTQTLQSIEQFVNAIRSSNAQTMQIADKSASGNQNIVQLSRHVNQLIEKFKT